MTNLPLKNILISVLASLSVGNAFGITDALKIKIAQGAYSDETVIRFLSGANGTFDGSYDAYKLFSVNAAVPNIFSKTTDGIDLSINAFSAFTTSQSVDVYLRINTAGTYTISAEELGTFAPSVCIMMKDLDNGTIYYLRTTSPYIITLPVISQTGPARFRVFFSYPVTLQSVDASSTASSDGQVTFNKPGETNWQYLVVNSSLNTIASGSASSSVIINTLASGNYTVIINSDFTCAESKSFFIGPVTYYTRASGNWEDASTWSTSSCGGAAASVIPSSTDHIVICSGNTVVLNAVQNINKLTISGSVSLNANVSFSGDFENNGTFTAGTNTVTLNGSQTQNISGSGSISFGGLVINNSTPANAVILQSPATVTGILKLQDGHIRTTSVNVLTLTPSGSVVLGASVQDSSFVKGPMKHTVNSNSGVIKIFPVGMGNSFRRIDLTVDQKLSTTTTYTAELINTSAAALGYSLPVTLSNVSGVRYHQITQSPSTTKIDVAEVRIYFNCMGGDDLVNNLGGLSVAQDNGAGSWIDLSDTPSGYVCGGSTYWGNTLSGTFTSLTGNKFALGNTGAPFILPVSFTEFSAIAQSHTVDLYWKTASEINCDHFIVERSIDGETFSPVGIVKGSGNSATEKKYVWMDELPYPGVSFYRLKQVDYNGTAWYSNAASVHRGLDELATVFPNPVTEDCFLMIKDSKDREATLIIHDLNGKECHSESFLPVSDNEIVHVSLIKKNLMDGIYVFSLESNGTIAHKKVIIKRN